MADFQGYAGAGFQLGGGGPIQHQHQTVYGMNQAMVGFGGLHLDLANLPPAPCPLLMSQPSPRKRASSEATPIDVPKRACPQGSPSLRLAPATPEQQELLDTCSRVADLLARNSSGGVTNANGPVRRTSSGIDTASTSSSVGVLDAASVRHYFDVLASPAELAGCGGFADVYVTR